MPKRLLFRAAEASRCADAHLFTLDMPRLRYYLRFSTLMFDFSRERLHFTCCQRRTPYAAASRR